MTSLPHGSITAENFGVFDADMGRAESGQVRVRVRRLGVNAGLAGRIGGSATAYGPGIGVGDVPASDAIVEVIDSTDPAFRPGDLAVGKSPWRIESVLDSADLRAIPRPKSDDELTSYLTILGHVGFTAYTGLTQFGEVRSSDVVAISGAAGGVGSCAVQFAKARGATVIGIAGSAQKVALLTDVLGADRAINRHDGAVVDQLRHAAPGGIDLFYDNVGGEQLEAALEVLNPHGRVVICGAIGQPAGPANYRNLIYQELTMRGFTVTAHEEGRPAFEAEVGAWLREGVVQSVHTLYAGLDRIPDAFASMLSGGTTGRAIVTLD
ncbi:NADP-dependent oxidoreductase [Glaciibacter psychrotolerans]